MTQELTPIERALPLLHQGPEILKDSRQRFTRAQVAGENILSAMPNGIQDADQDAMVKTYLDKAKATVDTMNTNRAEFTKALDIIKGEFTGLETALDPKKVGTITNKLQEYRNNYAKRLYEEQERQRKAAELQRKKDDEIARVTAELQSGISKAFSEYLDRNIRGLLNSFNEITLDNYEVKRVNLMGYSPTFDIEKYNDLTYSVYCKINSLYIQPTEVALICSKEAGESYVKYAEEFRSILLAKKVELVEMLPSKLQELQRIAAYEEEQRKAKEEADRLAAEAAKADGERRAQLEAQRQQQEQERKEREEQERIRQQQEQARIDAENARLEAERKERERLEAERIEQDRIAAETVNLFNATSAVTQVEEAPKMKTALKAVINHPAGAVQIFQMWFNRVGKDMTTDELTKKLSFCFTEVNKAANKDGETINSQFVTYENEVKAK